MRERIRGYADALLEDAVASGRMAAVADGVAGVAALLEASDELRDVLTDPGVAPHTRRAVVQDLFGGRIDADAVRLVQHVIDSDRAPDLPDDVAWLATRSAAIRDHRREIGITTVGRHAALERSEGYATAVLEGVDGEGPLSELEDQLFRFERAIDASPELTQVLTSRDLPVEARAGVVHDLLAGRALDATRRLATYLTHVGRPRDYIELLQALVARIGEEAHRRVALVRSAVALTAEQEDRLSAALSRIVGQQVDVRVTVDPTVLGGFVATIGDTVVDASVRHRLDLLRERLTTLPEATTI